MTEFSMDGTGAIETKGRGSRERGIDRVLKLFAYLGEHNEPVRVAELPKALGAPRSTIYELVRVLTESGLLEVSGAGNKVFFGKLMYLYGVNYVRENDVVRRGFDEVERLSKSTGETTELCVLHLNRQVIVHTHPGSRPMRISSDVGAQIPIPWTASGRLLLSHLGDTEIRALVQPEDLIKPDKTRIELDDFVRDCLEARGRDIVITRGLINSFTQCLASPIIGISGQIEATICLVLPIDIPDEHGAVLQAALVASSRRLSMTG